MTLSYISLKLKISIVLSFGKLLHLLIIQFCYLLNGDTAMRKILLVSLLYLLSLPSYALINHTITLTEQELQQQLNQIKSQQYQDGFLTVDLKNPSINLSSNNNKIALTGLVETLFLGNLKANANFRVLGKVRYQTQLAAFYLYDIELESLQSEQIPEQYIANIKGAVTQLLNQILKEQAIYTLSDDNLQEKLAKATLKEVEVKEGKLILTFSPF